MMMEQFQLHGKVALVTGASRGIGRSVAVALAEAGADLVLAARSQSGLDETAELVRKFGRRVLSVGVDVTDSAQVQDAVGKAISELGQIDVLVNNAGAQLVKPFLEFTPDEWQNVINTNLSGLLHMSHAVGKHMAERKRGSVINMGSIYGIVGAPGNSIYCLTKGGLHQFTRALSVEWSRYGIRVNAICPGWIQTALTEEYMQDERVVASALKQIPLRRFGEPEDIAPMAVYLASEAASYVTGQFFVIDGGQTAR